MLWVSVIDMTIERQILMFWRLKRREMILETPINENEMQNMAVFEPFGSTSMEDHLTDS